MEWAFLVALKLTTEQQRDNKVHCVKDICWVEAGGFTEAGGCTLALLARQADFQRQNIKILKVKGGNKCYQRPAREIVEVD
jgi:hypothetical protein